MPFRPPSDADVKRAVDAFLSTAANHPLDATFGKDDCPEDISFTQIEQLSHRLGKQLALRLTEQALERQSQQFDDTAACPQCQRVCRIVRHQREMISVDGRLTYSEPACHCETCRRDFFSGTCDSEDP
jgi:hypothetical protein